MASSGYERVRLFNPGRLKVIFESDEQASWEDWRWMRGECWG